MTKQKKVNEGSGMKYKWADDPNGEVFDEF